MSANNGVYILKSPVHPDADVFEYRVVHAMSIENITNEPDTKGFNTEQLRRYFSKCVVFHNKTMALCVADEVVQECGFVEYGIQSISLPFCFPR